MPEISETMDGVIQKCTVADCNVRYKSVEEITAALSADISVDKRDIQIDTDKDVQSDSHVEERNGNGSGHTIKIVDKEQMKVDA